MNNATLQEYKEHPYTVEVEKRDGSYYLLMSELNLVAVSDDVAAGFAELERNKEKLFEDLHAIDRLGSLPAPKNIAERTALKKSLTPFLIKAFAVALVGGLLIAAANVSIIYTLESTPKKLAQRSSRLFVKNFAKAFEEISRRDMSAEKEERIRTAIRNAVPVLRPYARELRPLFEEALNSGERK